MVAAANADNFVRPRDQYVFNHRAVGEDEGNKVRPHRVFGERVDVGGNCWRKKAIRFGHSIEG
jgi:hypothetical protein